MLECQHEFYQLHESSVSKYQSVEQCLYTKKDLFYFFLWVMGVDFQSPLIKNNNLFRFITSHSINSSKSELCLNRLAKDGPTNGDLINSRLGLNLLTNIASLKIQILIRWVIVQLWRYLTKANRKSHLLDGLRPLLSI